MSDKKDNDLTQLSGEIADGKKINWQQIKQRENQDPDLLEQLNVIDEINKTLQQNVSSEADNNFNSRQVLFNWGHLEVTNLIGEGSFGEVYQAYDSTLDRKVALKLLKQDKLAPYQSRAFIQEARRLAKVRNRHVLAVHGASINDSRVGMWSDLISGQNLNKTDTESYTTQHLMTVTAAMAEALRAVHEAGIIHGDIKPSNVMRDEQNKLVLMDFGAGIEHKDAADEQSSITSTPILMAPELFEGSNINQKTDIYALGGLLFNLATGKYPINAKNIADIPAAHKNNAYHSLDKLRPDINKKLRKLIQQMLSPTASNRPTPENIIAEIQGLKEAPAKRQKKLLVSALIIALFAGIMLSSFGFYQARKEVNKTTTVNQFLESILNSNAASGQGRTVKVADLLDDAANKVNQAYQDQPWAQAAMHDALANSYLSLQLPESALTQLQQSISVKKQLVNDNSLEILETQYQLAMAHQNLGQYSEASKLYQHIINQLNDNQSLQELSLIRMAQILNNQGQTNEAETILLPIIASLPNAKGNTDDNGYLAYFVLTEIKLKQSKFADAEHMAKQALEWLHNHPTESLTNLLQTNNLIAISLTQQGRLNESIPLLEQIVKQAEQLFGKNNLGYFNAITNLSAALQEHGQIQKALTLQEQAMQLAQTIEGFDQLNLIAISMNLANSKTSIGDYQGAESLMRNTLAQSIESLGENDIKTLQLEYNLAELLSLVGRFEEAQSLAELNLNKMQRTLGENHVFTHLALDNLAVSLAGQNRHEEAQKLFDQALDALSTSIPEPNPYAELVLKHQINSFQKNNQLKQLIPALNRLFNIQKILHGNNHPTTSETRRQLDEYSKLTDKE